MTEDRILARHPAVATMGNKALFSVEIARAVVGDAAAQGLVVLKMEGFRLEDGRRRSS